MSKAYTLDELVAAKARGWKDDQGDGMKIYVASSWRNPLQPDIVKILRAEGHEVYDFRHPHLGPGERGLGFQWSEIDPAWQSWSPSQYRDALKHPRARDGFAADLEGMRWADVGVLVMPCGRSAHAELGWMAGFGKCTMVLLADGEPELMYGLFDELCTSIDELLAALQERRGDGLSGAKKEAQMIG